MVAEVRRLAACLGAALCRGEATLATAESCTGGLLGKLITDVPGASAFYIEGIMSYSNAAKIRLLGVDRGLLDTCGAVSAEVAAAMAAGARRGARADYALSATGIAGPAGGSAEKPVGLVFIALAHHGGVEVEQLRCAPGWSREGVRVYAAGRSLLQLVAHLEGLAGGVAVRCWQPGDAAAVLALHDSTARQLACKVDPSFFADLADVEAHYLEGGAFVVAAQEDMLVGCGGLRRNADGTVEIVRMRVAPARQRRGIGRRILAALERHARLLGHDAVQLHTHVDQHAAQALYHSAGFEPCGRGTLAGNPVIAYRKALA